MSDEFSILDPTLEADRRVYTAPLAARSTYNMSNSTVATPESTIVEVVDSDGTIGYGEACLASPQFQPAHNDGIRSSLSVLAPAIVGLDPLKLSVVNSAMHAAIDEMASAETFRGYGPERS